MLILSLLGGGGKINITGALTDGANIGITVLPPTDNSPVTVTSGYNAYNSVSPDTYFSLDNDGQIQTSPFDYMTVVMGWNEDRTEVAVGTALYTVNFDMNGHGDAIDAVSLLSGYKVAEPTEPTADEWFFVDWFTDDAYTAQWNFDNTVTSNMTLHALWTQEAIYSIILPENMVIVSTTNAPVGGKYPVGTEIKFKLSSEDYVVDGDVKNGDDVLTTDGDGIYTITMGDADLTITAMVKKAVEPNKTLSGSESYTAQDGDVLTGSTSGTVTIANNAKITLSDVTITGGIVCEGTAEITLVGTNSVNGASQKAGIQVGGSGTTLTIKGNGSLTANGGSQSAGIGLSRAWDVDAMGGDIVIEGGNITATGDKFGAGIGTGVSYGNGTDNTATIGNITIKGGTVKAIGGTDQFTPGSGIGKGGAYSNGHAVVGTITIYDGIDMVDASSISESIVYMHETTDVTESKADYFTIGEDGNRILIVQKPVIADIPDQTFTGSEITPEPQVTIGSLSLTKGTDYVYSYTNNTNAGTATVKATFQGDYASLGYLEKTFRIIKLLTHSDITIDTIPDQTYSGSEICPEISVKDGETTLILGTDYTVECANNVSAGTANMTITGMGDYPGSVSKTFEITKAPLTITAKDKTIVYGDEPANDGVEYSGFVGSDDASVLGGTLTYGYNYKKGNKTGEYTITPGGLTADNYEINFVSGTLIVETKKTTFAAIQVFEDENGKRAEINGEYKGEGTVNIPKDIENVSVEFNRTFTVDKYSTIVLPFGIAAGSVEGAIFYKIDDIDVKIVGNDTIWGPVHIAKVTDNIEANTPYLLQPTATKLTFKELVTLNTSEKHPYGFTKAGVQWEFRGTYHYFDFANDSTHLVGKSYGFVAKDQADGLKVGQFRWTSTKSYILPMRGYLVYRSVENDDENANGGNSQKNAPMPQYVLQSFSTPSVSSIPETLDVKVVDKDGGTTVIGKINTRTGEIRLNSRMADRWFDLQGRVLNGKPGVKGRYLHNGKIEIVK